MGYLFCVVKNEKKYIKVTQGATRACFCVTMQQGECLLFVSLIFLFLTTLYIVPERISFPDEEEKILSYWDQIKAFETSLKLSEGKPEYSFYDGPPFATGLPHYGHLLAGTIKVFLFYFYDNKK